jgi:hypothetical protein
MIRHGASEYPPDVVRWLNTPWWQKKAVWAVLAILAAIALVAWWAAIAVCVLILSYVVWCDMDMDRAQKKSQAEMAARSDERLKANKPTPSSQ